MNKNNKSILQFTELTPEDIIIYRDIYNNLLTGMILHNNIPDKNGHCSYEEVPQCCNYQYYHYAARELHKAMQLFYEAFK